MTELLFLVPGRVGTRDARTEKRQFFHVGNKKKKGGGAPEARGAERPGGAAGAAGGGGTQVRPKRAIFKSGLFPGFRFPRTNTLARYGLSLAREVRRRTVSGTLQIPFKNERENVDFGQSSKFLFACGATDALPRVSPSVTLRGAVGDARRASRAIGMFREPTRETDVSGSQENMAFDIISLFRDARDSQAREPGLAAHPIHSSVGSRSFSFSYRTLKHIARGRPF